jgi:anti-sigma factor RsiW
MTLYTPEDLLQYLYEETSPAETAAIEQALAEDWKSREEFEALQSSASRLNSAIESPRTEVILRVMNYARQTMVEPV